MTVRTDRNRPLTAKLADHTSVKLIGLGGIGGIVAPYCGVFMAALGSPSRLVLIDGDAFELRNGERMLFSKAGNKAAVTRDDLLPRFARSKLSLVAIPEFITAENIGRLVQEHDIALLAVDNHATRKLVSSYCAGGRLKNIVLISGGNDGIEELPDGHRRRGTYGNAQIYVRQDDHDVSPPLTRYHPEIENPADKLPTDESCAELVAHVPQILFTNLAVASAMLNALWLHLAGALGYSEIAFDIADGAMRVVLPMGTAAPTRPGCYAARTSPVDPASAQ
ncbi:MAG: ThiF family adenylyltransferase [Tepidisphaerales bacterium]